MVMFGPALETLDYRLYKWPGHGVKENLSYQFVEKDYMKADEYDHFIADPSDYWLRVWLPRTHGALAPLADLPPMYGTMELPMAVPWLCTLGAPPVRKAYQTLLGSRQAVLRVDRNPGAVSGTNKRRRVSFLCGRRHQGPI